MGDSEYFVTEACEYTNSFLHFFPKIGVILNIDEDHLDFFKDLADIRNSFHRFAKLLPKDGTLVINDNIPDLEEITADLDCRVIRYGNDSSLDYSATNILHDKKGEASFDLIKSGNLSTESPYLSTETTMYPMHCLQSQLLIFSEFLSARSKKV